MAAVRLRGSSARQHAGDAAPNQVLHTVLPQEPAIALALAMLLAHIQNGWGQALMCVQNAWCLIAGRLWCSL